MFNGRQTQSAVRSGSTPHGAQYPFFFAGVFLSAPAPGDSLTARRGLINRMSVRFRLFRSNSSNNLIKPIKVSIRILLAGEDTMATLLVNLRLIGASDKVIDGHVKVVGYLHSCLKPGIITFILCCRYQILAKFALFEHLSNRYFSVFGKNFDSLRYFLWRQHKKHPLSLGNT